MVRSSDSHFVLSRAVNLPGVTRLWRDTIRMTLQPPALPRLAAPAVFLLRVFCLVFLFVSAASPAGPNAQRKQNVLVLTEVGLSHSLTSVITQQLARGVEGADGLHVEFYTESLDLLSFPGRPTYDEIEAWLKTKYGKDGADLIVAIGPDVVRFLAQRGQDLFPQTPIVICGSARDQANVTLDARFTGTWTVREPVRTLDLARLLLPQTRRVYVVSGTSPFDQFIYERTHADLVAYDPSIELNYLNGLSAGELLRRIQSLPEHSLVFYLTFFEDADGKKFVNATTALPMISAASNAPLFSMSDTYLGHGIVGGEVMNFQKQGELTAGIVLQVLRGKRPSEIPIETLPSSPMFDWKELRRWNIPESSLPTGSLVFFREPTLWQRTRWMWLSAFAALIGLLILAAYLQYSRGQLELARARHQQLSGMLIDATEKERSRVANELHDDFSQRLAVMTLKLEGVSRKVSPDAPEAAKLLEDLIRSSAELGRDLHSLSHSLHSSTLQSLGLIPAVSALCKEFSAQEGVQTDFTSEGIPRKTDPDVALCLFRVVQESLRNIKRHSGAASATVDLRRAGDWLSAAIEDHGAGFDVAAVKQAAGLGLRAMEERVTYIGGHMQISSTPGRGTRIFASVPLSYRREPASHPPS